MGLLEYLSILANGMNKKLKLLQNTFHFLRQKAEEEIKTFLDEESHKNNFFFDLRNLGKNFLLIS